MHLDLSPRCLRRAATSACSKEGPKPGEHVPFFRMKKDRNKGFSSEKCNWKPPSHSALKGLGILCREMCYRHLRSCSGHVFKVVNCLLDTGGGGGGGDMVHDALPPVNLVVPL